MSKGVLLLFDFNNILHKALATTPGLRWKDKNTGGLFGFVQQVSSYVNEHCPTDIVFCMDRPPYIRKKVFPQYKQARTSDKNDMWYQIYLENKGYCEQFLKVIDVKVAEKEGYEADDWIAAVCSERQNDYDKIVIVSNDDDLFQTLVYENVFLHRSGKQKGLYGRKEFENEYPGVHPSSWVMISALTGGHNGLPGIKGVGIKKAIKIIKDEELYNSYLNDDLKLWVGLAILPYDDKLRGRISFGDWVEKPYLQNIEFWLREFGIRMTDLMEKAIIQLGVRI